MFSRQKSLQMKAVMAALAADRDGKQPDSTCPVCGTRLKVIKLPEIGRTTVTCENGCTTAHFSYEPQPAKQGS
jgi:hypothetical protein